MILGGLQRLTLIDYPGKIACAVFTLGCDFRCPFCHNPELVIAGENSPRVSEREFFHFLKRRVGRLDGVCITGGEPVIQKDIKKFIKKIKTLGFLVKLDTNGSQPDIIKELISEKLVDYVAMDIKAPPGLKSQAPNIKSSPRGGSPVGRQINSPSASSLGPRGNSRILKYEEATGIKIDIENIKESIEIIKSSGIEYEFRTTAVPGLHTEEDFIAIGKWLSGARVFYLQEYREIKIFDEKLRDKTRGKKFDLQAISEKLKPYFKKVVIRK